MYYIYCIGEKFLERIPQRKNVFTEKG